MVFGSHGKTVRASWSPVGILGDVNMGGEKIRSDTCYNRTLHGFLPIDPASCEAIAVTKGVQSMRTKPEEVLSLLLQPQLGGAERASVLPADRLHADTGLRVPRVKPRFHQRTALETRSRVMSRRSQSSQCSFRKTASVLKAAPKWVRFAPVHILRAGLG